VRREGDARRASGFDRPRRVRLLRPEEERICLLAMIGDVGREVLFDQPLQWYDGKDKRRCTGKVFCPVSEVWSGQASRGRRMKPGTPALAGGKRRKSLACHSPLTSLSLRPSHRNESSKRSTATSSIFVQASMVTKVAMIVYSSQNRQKKTPTRSQNPTSPSRCDDLLRGQRQRQRYYYDFDSAIALLHSEPGLLLIAWRFCCC
jgi:hypothetical protein